MPQGRENLRHHKKGEMKKRKIVSSLAKHKKRNTNLRERKEKK